LKLFWLTHCKVRILRSGKLPNCIGEIRSWLPPQVPGAADIGDKMHGLMRMKGHLSEFYINVELQLTADLLNDGAQREALAAA
jgi:hypothetical protein